MRFDENMLAAIAALGRHIMDIAAQAEVDRSAKIDLMQKVCGLECELDAARDRIKAVWIILNGLDGGSVETQTLAERVKEALR